jgi:hypothetical protein
MPKERTAAPLAEFVKFRAVGARVLGRVTKFDTNDNGSFIVLHPAYVLDAGEREPTRYEEIAIGLTADMRGKITPSDVGSMLVIGMVGEKPTNKGNPTKLFKVMEVAKGENFVEVITNDELFKPVTANPFDEQDELPF